MPVKTRRLVDTPDGGREWCYVIETELRIGSMKKTVDLTLVKREDSIFRLHLSPQAISGPARVNPKKSYLTGEILGNFATSSVA